MDEEERCPLDDAAVAADSSPDGAPRSPEMERRGGCSRSCCSCPRSSVLARVKRHWMMQEAIAICKLAVPMVSTMFFQQLMFTLSLVYVGHITGHALELDAAALAISVINVTGVSVGHGLASAAETLCAQAYGFKNYKRVGMITQRGIFILALAMFPVLVVWLNTESLLLLMQQDACVSRLSSLYVRIFSTSLPALFLFIMIQRYLQAQSIVLPFVLVGIATNVISVALHGILIYGFDLGLMGSAIALAVATIAATLLLLLYIRVRKLHRETWSGWSWESLREWRQFVRLAIPGLLMLCCEWWCYEFSTFVTGSVSKTQLAIHTILVEVLAVNFMVPMGVGMAITVRVGNELGAGNPLKAKRTTYTAFVMTGIHVTLMTTFLFSVRTVFGRLFSSDRDIVDGVATVSFVGIPLMIFDSFQGVIQGVLRGTGKQLSGAIINFVAFYLIGFPLGVVLAVVVGLGALGMWTGLLVASVIQTSSYFVIVLVMNWEKESQKAMKRSQDHPVDTHPASSGHSDQDSITSGHGDQDSTSSGPTEVGVWEEREEEGEEGDTAPLVFRESVDSGIVVATQDVLPLTASSPSSLGPSSTDEPTEVETFPLIPLEEEDDHRPISKPSSSSSLSPQMKSNIKLLFLRLPFFLVGAVLLVLGGVASQYHPHRPAVEYCDCEHMTGNITEGVCGNETMDIMLGTGFPSPSYTFSSSFYLLPTSTPVHN